LGNYLQCNRGMKPGRKPKPIPTQGNYPLGYLGQKTSVTATNISGKLLPFPLKILSYRMEVCTARIN